MLHMLMSFLSNNMAMKIALSSRNALIDAGLQTALLKLLDLEQEDVEGVINEDMKEVGRDSKVSEIRATAEQLLHRYCAVLSSAGSPSEERAHIKFSRVAAVQLIKELDPAHNLAHKRIEASLCRAVQVSWIEA